MRYFPVFMDLRGKRVVLVGTSEKALFKVRLLLKTEARVELIGPDPVPELGNLLQEGRIFWIAEAFEPKILEGAALVFCADMNLNRAVSEAARHLGIPVNTVDDPELCSFITPSIVDRDPLVVAIGTEGAAPVLGQRIRAQIDALLPLSLGPLARAAHQLRPRVTQGLAHGIPRRTFWQSFFNGTPSQAFQAGDDAMFSAAVETSLVAAAAPQGRVSLVDVSVEAPDLLTLRAHRCLMDADIIVHDADLDPAFLEMARRDAVRILADGTGSDAFLDSIHKKGNGQHVVRLIAGTPEGLGRTAAFFADAGVPLQIFTTEPKKTIH